MISILRQVMKINKIIYSQIYSDRQRKEQWRRTNGLNSCTLRTRYLPFSVTWPLMWHLVVATCLFSLKLTCSSIKWDLLTYQRSYEAYFGYIRIDLVSTSIIQWEFLKSVIFYCIEQIMIYHVSISWVTKHFNTLFLFFL